MGATTVRAEIGTEAYRVSIRAGRHGLVADEPPALGGGDAGPGPFALVVAGLGACTVITLRMYAERKALPVEQVTADLALRRAGDSWRIERHVVVDGALTDAQLARFAEIAEKTPVTLALKPGFDIRTTVERSGSTA